MAEVTRIPKPRDRCEGGLERDERARRKGAMARGTRVGAKDRRGYVDPCPRRGGPESHIPSRLCDWAIFFGVYFSA